MGISGSVLQQRLDRTEQKHANGPSPLPTNRGGNAEGLRHPLPVPSETGIGLPFTRFPRVIGGFAADRTGGHVQSSGGLHHRQWL